MERRQTQTNYHDRYDNVSTEMLCGLIEAHEAFIRDNVDLDIDHPYMLEARVNLMALWAQLEARGGE